MDLQLKGKVAVVTGGSRGIGKAVARALAQEGTSVALIARDPALLALAADDLARETGSKVKGFSTDTRDNKLVNETFARIASEFGCIDILVNCAAQPGGQAKPPGLAEISDEFFHEEMNTKVMGYLRCAREAVPHMQRKGWGRIVSVSGLAARQTGAIVGSVRNVAVAAMTKNLADELGPQGINVTCVHPGMVRTEKSDGVFEWMAGQQGKPVAEIEANIAKRSALNRILTAEEVAQVVLFLASPKSIAVNGESIGAGGGTPGAIFY